MSTISAEQLAQPDDCGAEKHYHQLLEDGVFAIQRCGDCAKFIFYPRMVCPHCGSTKLNWEEASGQGEVYSTTTVRRKPERGGDYNVALINLKEGVRMMSRVEGISPEDVKIGMSVQSQIIQENDTPLIVFTPQSTGEMA